MVDGQGPDPAKRVVKRVVKKTVVRPSASSPAPADPAPKPAVRYGRPVATASRPSQGTASPATRTTTAKAKVAAPTTRPTAPKIKRQAPSIDVRAKVAGARDVAGRAWWAVADTTTDAARATGRFTAARARTVAAWRLPHLNPYLAAVVTGAVVGLLAVLLGAATLSLFSAVRGVSSGGGLWGGLAFTAVAIVCVFAGEALLRGFGTQAARLTSVLAVILTIIAMLGLFLDLVDGTLGLVLLPLIGVAAYALAHWLLDLAENTPSLVE
ncbi:hypothetical protein IFT73_09235 [Aeromicrobium sp. CFBP 8757]|uniref:hypothetical protein n=1 Tax=Aeromicrobium sp. CFBP 8757 TaxID=2775288 RepID=UPI0017813047|nr:hypothetical protein [Aeromicrobium sp. CFBP 8757]MBD8607036.1 hypothetical protein [Aeromicrobium sp. CFBP 8757]